MSSERHDQYTDERAALEPLEIASPAAQRRALVLEPGADRMFRRGHTELQLYRYDWLLEQRLLNRLGRHGPYGGALTKTAWQACAESFQKLPLCARQSYQQMSERSFSCSAYGRRIAKDRLQQGVLQVPLN